MCVCVCVCVCECACVRRCSISTNDRQGGSDDLRVLLPPDFQSVWLNEHRFSEGLPELAG